MQLKELVLVVLLCPHYISFRLMGKSSYSPTLTKFCMQETTISSFTQCQNLLHDVSSYLSGEDTDIQKVFSVAISEYISLTLLNFDDVDTVADLVVESNFKPSTPRFDDDQMSILKTLSQKFEEYCKKDMKRKVKDGFLARAYNRLLHPSLSLSEDSIIFVLNDTTLPQQIFGVVEVYPTREPYLCNFAISESRRRQGYGRLLCEFCEMLVTQLWGKSALTLHVEKSNLSARRFYEAMNYSESAMFHLNNLRNPDGNRRLVYYRKTLEHLLVRPYRDQ